MNKANIVFVIPSLKAGGAERVISTLCNAIVSNFSITIIVLYKSPSFYYLDPKINIIYCNDSYNPKQTIFQSVNNHFRCIRKIYKTLKQNKTQVVIGFMTTTNVYAIIAGKLAKVPSIISERVHPDFIDASKFWFKIRKLVYPWTNYLVVQTHDIARYFSSYLQDEKLKIILNPLNTELTNKRNLDISKENIILNIGRLDYQKNQDLLIRAFAKTNYKDWKLIILGEGKKKDDYIKLINQLGLSNHVMLLGNVEDVWNYYNKARIFAFTSRFEGFPNALTEAMYFGLPCISTDCPSGPSELINDGVNGFLIPIEDQDLLEQKLQALMENDMLRNELGQQAMLNTDRFDVDQIASEWEELIYNLQK